MEGWFNPRNVEGWVYVWGAESLTATGLMILVIGKGPVGTGGAGERCLLAHFV